MQVWEETVGGERREPVGVCNVGRQQCFQFPESFWPGAKWLWAALWLTLARTHWLSLAPAGTRGVSKLPASRVWVGVKVRGPPRLGAHHKARLSQLTPRREQSLFLPHSFTSSFPGSGWAGGKKQPLAVRGLKREPSEGEASQAAAVLRALLAKQRPQRAPWRLEPWAMEFSLAWRLLSRGKGQGQGRAGEDGGGEGERRHAAESPRAPSHPAGPG